MKQIMVGAILLLALTTLGCSSKQPAATSPPPAGVKPAAPAAAPAATPAPAVTPAPPKERSGVIGRKSGPQTLLGDALAVGAKAPAFTAVDAAGKVVSSKDFEGKVVVVSVVPSIDTPVCEAQTGRMASEEPSLPEGVTLVTVSRDTPHAQKRFLGEGGFKTTMWSDHRAREFGDRWGLEVKETGYLARSIWILDRQGRIAYRELVADQGTEPDYGKLKAALQKVTAR